MKVEEILRECGTSIKNAKWSNHWMRAHKKRHSEGGEVNLLNVFPHGAGYIRQQVGQRTNPRRIRRLSSNLIQDKSQIASKTEADCIHDRKRHLLTGCLAFGNASKQGVLAVDGCAGIH